MYLDRRDFYFYNLFAWWALASTIFIPWLYYWGGDYIDRPVFLYP